MKINVGKTKETRTGKNEDVVNIFLEEKTVEHMNSSEHMRST